MDPTAEHANTEQPNPELSLNDQWNQWHQNPVREIRSHRTGHETRQLLASCHDIAYDKADDMIRDGCPPSEREIMAQALYGQNLDKVACLSWFSLPDVLKAVREPASGARASS